jgi:isochorismate hydrolase
LVVLSAIGVKEGVRGRTVPALADEPHDIAPVDRHAQNAWESPKLVEAVNATGRERLVIGGIVTSACPAQVSISAIADGYDVIFDEDAVGDSFREHYDEAVLGLAHPDAIPNTTMAMMGEWFRDWKSPLTASAFEPFGPYRGERAASVIAPEQLEVVGLETGQ